MEEEVKYTSEFDGQTTDEVLKHAKSVKDLTIPSLSNISGFVCIDNEGKAIGMMSKEQVAQVVGGLLPIFKHSTEGYSGDLNDISYSGIITLKSQCTNCPEDSNGLAAFLINLVWDIDASYQLFFDTINSKLFVRVKLNRNWKGWIEIQRVL